MTLHLLAGCHDNHAAASVEWELSSVAKCCTIVSDREY